MRTPQEYIRIAARKIDVHQDQLRLKLYVNNYNDGHQNFTLTDSWTNWCMYGEAGPDNKGLYQSINLTLQKRTGTSGDGEYWHIIHQFKLTPFPDCCGIVISHAASTDWNHRNKGLNTLFNQLRRELATTFGYSSMICTDVADNEPEVKTLNRAGFSHIHQFHNKRSNNNVNVSVVAV